MRGKSLFITLSFIAVIVGLVFIIVYQQRLLLLTDISTKPITRTPEQLQRKNPVYMVSYADGKEIFYRNQLALAESALGRGVDVIMNYRRSMLDPKFVEKNRGILDQKSGAGYWLWKPWVILDAMKKAPEDAIIIYADGGSVIKAPLDDLIELAEHKPIVLVEYEDAELYGKLGKNTKREVFMALNCDKESCYQSPYLWAGFMVLRNTPVSRKFIETWLEYCQRPELLIQGPSSKPEIEMFVSHFHDQSILGVLATTFDKKYIELVPYDDLVIGKHLVWHHRRPGARPDDPLAIYRSLKPHYALERKLNGLEKKIYNFWPLKKLREYMIESKTQNKS